MTEATQVAQQEVTAVETVTTVTEAPKVKRGRGRPRKVVEVVAQAGEPTTEGVAQDAAPLMGTTTENTTKTARKGQKTGSKARKTNKAKKQARKATKRTYKGAKRGRKATKNLTFIQKAARYFGIKF